MNKIIYTETHVRNAFPEWFTREVINPHLDYMTQSDKVTFFQQVGELHQLYLDRMDGGEDLFFLRLDISLDELEKSLKWSKLSHKAKCVALHNLGFDLEVPIKEQYNVRIVDGGRELVKVLYGSERTDKQWVNRRIDGKLVASDQAILSSPRHCWDDLEKEEALGNSNMLDDMKDGICMLAMRAKERSEARKAKRLAKRKPTPKRSHKRKPRQTIYKQE